MRMFILALSSFISIANAQAFPIIRVPVVMDAWSIKKNEFVRFWGPDIANELRAHNLRVLDYIYIDEPSKQEELSVYGFEVARAGIGMPGTDSALSVVSNRMMADYEILGREKICYISSSKTPSREEAENALALYGALDLEILDSDYSIQGARFFDESEFSDASGDYDPDELNKKYSSRVLMPGEIQIIATRGSAKEYEEILSPCK